jgi:hypothetical protein
MVMFSSSKVSGILLGALLLKCTTIKPHFCENETSIIGSETKTFWTFVERMCHKLLAHDDELWVLEMTIVKKPYVLDFAGAYLDHPPDYSIEVLNEWRVEKEEQFGDRWPEVKRILRTLENYGIFLADVTPNNIAISD